MNAYIDLSAVTLKTERLILRPFAQKDLNDLFSYASEPGVGEMAGWPHHESMETSQMILNHFIEEKKTFALEYMGRVIGSLGVELYKEAEFPGMGEQKGREIGYVLSREYWGLGLMSEAVREALRYLFEDVGLDFVACGHFANNRQSARVQEKCGFHFFGISPYETQMGTLETSVNHILTRQDWERAKKARANELLSLIETRRSYRGAYKAVPVPREDLKAILRAGLDAPSGCNKQTVSLIAVDDPETLALIRAVIDPPVAQTAPAMICVLTRRVNAYRDRCFAVQDYAASIENMLLAAHALGYESCWYEGHITDDDRICDKIAQCLNVPQGYDLVCILPIGVAADTPKAPRKMPFEERAWFNSFGKSASPKD